MTKRNVEVLVGLFMLLGGGALLILAIKVSGLNELYTHETGYTITADFSNVAGLKTRSRVTVAGVPVGRVMAITFDKQNYAAQVTLWIKDSVDNLPLDSRASILTAGFLGDNYVGITPGYSAQYLKEGGHISLEETNAGIVLEDLVAKFLAGQASNTSNK